MATEPPHPSPAGKPTTHPPPPRVPPLPGEPVIPEAPDKKPDEEVDDANPPRPKDISSERAPLATGDPGTPCGVRNGRAANPRWPSIGGGALDRPDLFIDRTELG